jgi:hypothetical protein
MYFQFWLFNWTNSVTKYSGLSESDFDIDSVAEDFALDGILPEAYRTSFEEPIPSHKGSS